MWGKVLGAMLGGAVGLLMSLAPLFIVALAAVGTLLGHVLVDAEPQPRSGGPRRREELADDGARRPPRPLHPPPPRTRPPTPARDEGRRAEQRLLADLLCPLFIEIARADSGVVQPEIRVAREFFEQALCFDADGMEAVRLALKSALAAPEQDISHLVRRARSEVKPSLRVEVVRALYDMGTADAELSSRERDLLKHVVEQFNLSDEQLQQITTEHFGDAAQHYRTLGIAPDASDDEVRAAFRRKAAENHPDRVAASGPEAVAAAAERFRAVKDAWETLRKIRGI